MTPPLSSSYAPKSDTRQYGYVRHDVNGVQVIVLDWAAAAVIDALQTGTLHDWAAQQLLKEQMQGRGVIFAVNLPTIPATPVVIRRNRHGGVLGGLTGEYFISPTRAPFELATALRLAAAGIPTPEVIAYAIYPTAGMFARSDVMTRRLPEGDDAPAAWQKLDGEHRNLLLTAVARLLCALARAGAWHADLNLKNIYITGKGTDMTAYLLDVDRVTFPVTADVAARNFDRLARSVRKWRKRWGLDFDEQTLSHLADLVEENK